MKQRWAALCALIVVGAAVGFWWWRGRTRSDLAATPPVTQPHGSASQPATAPSAPAKAAVAVAIGDAKGPIADAVVRLAPDDGEVMIVRSGRDGVAHAELTAGEWTISASAAEHEPAALAARAFAAGEHVDLAIKLAGGGRLLTGLVTDASGGPIAGVRIDAAKLGGGNARPDRAVATTLTGGDGRYKLTVNAGQLLVAASHADYAPQAHYVEVAAAGATADFALVPGGVIEGVVRDAATRQSVAGATVTAERQGASVFLAETGAHAATSGADGHFRIGGLRPGAYELGAREHQRLARPPTRVGLGVAEQLGNVEILIASAPVIRGSVVKDGGAPAPGATIVALAPEGNGEAIAGPDGSFVFEGLHAGRWTLMAQGADYITAQSAQVDLADQDVTGVKLTVSRGFQLTGHVEPRQICDVALETPAGPGLQLSPTSVTTAADGEFSLDGLYPGNATLIGHCASGDQGTLAVAVPGKEVVLAVKPGASIAGRVVDGDGKPIANVTAIASLDGPHERTTIVNGMVTSGFQGLTSASGAFELRGLPAGSYRLQALDRGHPLPSKRPLKIALAATEHRTGVELVVDRANGTIEGTVTGPDGKPLGDAWVSARQDVSQMMAGLVGEAEGPGDGRMMTVANSNEGGAAGDIPPALTDANGHFAITGLARAHYQILAEAQGGALRGTAPDVTPDATIAIQALGLASLHGTVHAATLPALFTVELASAGSTDPAINQRSFTGGATFDFDHVDPGAYLVKVTSSAGNGEAPVTIAAGQAATVDVTLVENAIVIGRLVDPAGHPLANLPVIVIPDAGDGHARVSLEGPPPTSSADGSFRLETKAGKSMLLVLLQPPLRREGLQLEAGKTLDIGAWTIDAAAPASHERHAER